MTEHKTVYSSCRKEFLNHFQSCNEIVVRQVTRHRIPCSELRVGCTTEELCVPGKGQRLTFPPKHPDCLWGPHSTYLRPNHQAQCSRLLQLLAHFSLLPKIKIAGNITPFPPTPSYRELSL